MQMKSSVNSKVTAKLPANLNLKSENTRLSNESDILIKGQDIASPKNMSDNSQRHAIDKYAIQ